MIPALRFELILTENGKLSLDQLPFKVGQAVEVIVLATTPSHPAPTNLRGTVLQFDGPTDPVADTDWDALK